VANEPAPDIGVFTTDLGLVIRVWDDWLAAATGIPADHARGRHVSELIPDLESRGLRSRFDDVLTSGAVQVLAPAFHHYLVPCPPCRPSSRFDRMQQRVTIGPLRDGDRRVGVMVAIEDVTARLDAERDLAAALESPDVETRRNAAGAIAAAGRIEAPDQFRRVLADDDPLVRRAGVRGLARTADAAFISSLVDALRDEHLNFNVLSSALTLLAESDVDVTVPLAALLQHHDPALRMQAALALGVQHDEAAIAPLVAALDDPDQNVRFHVIESLGQLRAAAAVDALLEIVESRDFFLAFAAIDALALISDGSVAVRLASFLTDPALALPIVDALGSLGDDDMVAPLLEVLNRPDATVETAAAIADAIAGIHHRSERDFGVGEQIVEQVRTAVTASGTQHLLEAMKIAEPERLRAVVRLLGWIDGPEVRAALARQLADAEVRGDVVESLVRHGSRVVDLLVAQLAAEDDATRLAAITALGRVGDRRATPALIDALDDSPEIVVAAAAALAKLGDARAFEPLLRLVAHRDPSVRQATIGALNSLGHPDMPARVAVMLDDSDPRVRESAVRIAGYFGYRETAARLIASVTDPEETVRRAALEHLPYLDDPAVVPAMTAALDRETPRVRAEAARALARTEHPQAVEALRRALGDADGWVRYYAARSLGELQDRASTRALSALAADDAAPHVRIAALEALGTIGGAAASAALRRLSADPQSDVAAAALTALGHVADAEGLAPLQQALRSGDVSRRSAAVRALIAHASAAAVNALEWTAAADSDAAVARLAIDGLGQVAAGQGAGVDAAVEALTTLLADHAQRPAAVAALARLPVPLIPKVGRGLQHAAPAVRCATLEALARFRQPESTRLLESALDDSAADVREVAVVALTRLGTLGAADRFAVLARQDPSKAVRRAAAAALARIRPSTVRGSGPGE
jgi:HEAT repeat protein